MGVGTSTEIVLLSLSGAESLSGTSCGLSLDSDKIFPSLDDV